MFNKHYHELKRKLRGPPTPLRWYSHQNPRNEDQWEENKRKKTCEVAGRSQVEGWSEIIWRIETPM